MKKVNVYIQSPFNKNKTGKKGRSLCVYLFVCLFVCLSVRFCARSDWLAEIG